MIDIEALANTFTKIETVTDREFELHGFNLDLVGLDCAGWIEPDEPWACPFTPGCGNNPGPDCPLMRRRAAIAHELTRTRRVKTLNYRDMTITVWKAAGTFQAVVAKRDLCKDLPEESVESAKRIIDQMCRESVLD